MNFNRMAKKACSNLLSNIIHVYCASQLLRHLLYNSQQVVNLPFIPSGLSKHRLLTHSTGVNRAKCNGCRSELIEEKVFAHVLQLWH